MMSVRQLSGSGGAIAGWAPQAVNERLHLQYCKPTIERINVVPSCYGSTLNDCTIHLTSSKDLESDCLSVT